MRHIILVGIRIANKIGCLLFCAHEINSTRERKKEKKTEKANSTLVGVNKIHLKSTFAQSILWHNQ